MTFVVRVAGSTGRQQIRHPHGDMCSGDLVQFLGPDEDVWIGRPSWQGVQPCDHAPGGRGSRSYWGTCSPPATSAPTRGPAEFGTALSDTTTVRSWVWSRHTGGTRRPSRRVFPLVKGPLWAQQASNLRPPACKAYSRKRSTNSDNTRILTSANSTIVGSLNDLRDQPTRSAVRPRLEPVARPRFQTDGTQRTGPPSVRVGCRWMPVAA